MAIKLSKLYKCFAEGYNGLFWLLFGFNHMFKEESGLVFTSKGQQIKRFIYSLLLLPSDYKIYKI
jgi:hypothetical protein